MRLWQYFETRGYISFKFEKKWEGPADKGGSIILLDRSFYRKELLGQLMDSIQVSVKLTGDSTDIWKRSRCIIIHSLSGAENSEKCCQYLSIDFPRCLIIYTLLKVHKLVTSPTGQSIIALGSLFSNTVCYLDTFLQPVCHKILPPM